MPLREIRSWYGGKFAEEKAPMEARRHDVTRHPR
jgi:hypothetical protein